MPIEPRKVADRFNGTRAFLRVRQMIQQFSQAEGMFKQALKQAPRDYAGLLLMAKCQLVQEKDAEAVNM